MTIYFTFLASCVSAGAIAYLAFTDAKRRRALRVSPWDKNRRTKLTLVAVLAPGFSLLFTGNAAAFCMWAGAIILAGWLIVVASPIPRRAATKESLVETT